mgnify:FL=1
MKWNRGTDFADDAIGVGMDGFTDGDPGAEPVVPASEVGDEWLNAVTSEICRAIELLGGTLSYADNAQLGTLLAAMNARLASQHFVYTTTKTRTVYVPLTAFAPEIPGDWSYGGLGWVSLVNSGVLTCDLTPYIPAGATLTATTAIYKSGASATIANSVEHKLTKYTFAVVGNAGTDVIPWTSASTTGWQGGLGDDGHTQYLEVNAPSGCNPLNAIDTKAAMLIYACKASVDGFANADILYGVMLSITADAYVSNW